MLNELRDKIHATALEKGWWDNGDRPFGEIIALCHSELSEALEEYRNGRTPDETYTRDGHSKPEGIPIEFADVIIRILDYCGYHDIDIEAALEAKMQYNTGRAYKHGGKVI